MEVSVLATPRPSAHIEREEGSICLSGGTLRNVAQYRIHFIDHGDNAFTSDSFEAPHDSGVIDQTSTRFRTNIGKGHETWQDGRHVHTERYGSRS